MVTDPVAHAVYDRTQGSADPRFVEQHSHWWQREFTRGADPEYEEQFFLIDGLGGRRGRVLDIGCGEGQVSCLLSSTSTKVFGIDPAWSQIREAVRRSTQEAYSQASATALPFTAEYLTRP